MVIERIALEDVAAHLSELVEEVRRGGEVVITDGDEPVARLVSYPQAERTPRFGSAKGLITIADDFDEPLEDLEEYMR